VPLLRTARLAVAAIGACVPLSASAPAPAGANPPVSDAPATPEPGQDPLVLAGLLSEAQADYSRVVAEVRTLDDSLAKPAGFAKLYQETVNSQTAQLKAQTRAAMDQHGFYREKAALEAVRSAWAHNVCSTSQVVPPDLYAACHREATQVNTIIEKQQSTMDNILAEVKQDPAIRATISVIARAKAGIEDIHRQNAATIAAAQAARVRATVLSERVKMLRAALVHACDGPRTETIKHCSSIPWDNFRADLPLIPPTPFD
jgi:hypothetical protein